jgi:hypothetical protein
MNEDGIVRLVGSIYDAPGGADAWAELPLSISRALRSEHGHLVLFGPDLTVPLDFATLREGGEAYVRDFANFDVRTQRIMRGPDRTPTSHLDVMTASELRHCPLHQEFYPRFGIEHSLISKTNLSAGHVYITGAMRTPAQGQFTTEEYRLHGIFHTHLERAMRLHLELLWSQAEVSAYEAGLDARR